MKFVPIGLYACILASFFVLSGCDIFVSGDVTETTTVGVLVSNHGNPDAENGSVTVYDPRDQTARTVIEDIGSTVHSVTPLGSRLYVASTSEDRVDVYNLTNFTHITEIEDIDSPRQIIQVTDSDALVSMQPPDEGSTLQGIDLFANQPSGVPFFTDGRADGLTVAGGLIFAAIGAGGPDDALATPEVAVADPVEVLDAVFIDCYARYILSGPGNTVLAPCNPETGEGQVVVLDADAREVIHRYELDGTVATAIEGQNAVRSERNQELFVVLDEERITRIDLIDEEIIDVLGPLEGDPIGAVGFDEHNEHLYVARVPNLEEPGEVTIHTVDGERIARFDAGIAPNYMHFQIGRQ